MVCLMVVSTAVCRGASVVSVCSASSSLFLVCFLRDLGDVLEHVREKSVRFTKEHGVNPRLLGLGWFGVATLQKSESHRSVASYTESYITIVRGSLLFIRTLGSFFWVGLWGFGVLGLGLAKVPPLPRIVGL